MECAPDLNSYEKGIKVTDEDFDGINPFVDEWHGDLDYAIRPHEN